MRVLIAYNEPVLPPTHPEAASEREVLDVVETMAGRLNRPGVELIQCGVRRDFATFRDALNRVRPDVVLNLFEGFGDDPDSEYDFAQLLESESVVFTGASSEALRRTGRKDVAKQILRAAGVSTSPWFVVQQLPANNCQLEWPVIVKPASRDASVGIHQASVATSRAQLSEQIGHAAAEYGFPILVEEFIRGREVSTALFDWPELTVLPIVETCFASVYGRWPIDCYDAKWNADAASHPANSLSYPAELGGELTDRVVAMAKAAYLALGCRGFVTIDFRIRDQTPYILEINSNADLKPSTCFTDLLRLAGLEYNDFVWQMVCAAVDRRGASAKTS